jgi:hypothetical protein
MELYFDSSKISFSWAAFLSLVRIYRRLAVFDDGISVQLYFGDLHHKYLQNNENALSKYTGD